MTILTVSGLTKSFDGVCATNNVSFSVGRRELLALIGPNGAGKTTTFNLIGGQSRPDAGEIRFCGEAITGLSPRAIFHKGIGRTFQIAQTFVSMSVVENVQMALISAHGETRALWRPASARYRREAFELLDAIGMAEQADRACAVLAYADIKRIELAIALAGKPKLLLMDEPTAGMPLKDRATLMELIAGLARAHNFAVLFTEHDMNVVFKHADRVIVLVRGEVIASGEPDAVRSNPMVQEAYIGDKGFRASARPAAVN